MICTAGLCELKENMSEQSCCSLQGRQEDLTASVHDAVPDHSCFNAQAIRRMVQRMDGLERHIQELTSELREVGGNCECAGFKLEDGEQWKSMLKKNAEGHPSCKPLSWLAYKRAAQTEWELQKEFIQPFETLRGQVRLNVHMFFPAISSTQSLSCILNYWSHTTQKETMSTCGGMLRQCVVGTSNFAVHNFSAG